MADTIEHVNVPNSHRHEPKGISTASTGEVYVSDGSGSGSWDTLEIFTGSSYFPVGTVVPFAGTTAPGGWSLCDGTPLSRVTYSNLFSVVGITYGLGDGSTTFNLPDCRGRISVGKDNMNSDAARVTTAGSGVDGDTLGAVGGTERVQATANNLPVLTGTAALGNLHTHAVSPSGAIIRSAGSAAGWRTGTGKTPSSIAISTDGAHTHTFTVNAGSSNTPHNNVQPTIIMNMMIYHGVFS